MIQVTGHYAMADVSLEDFDAAFGAILGALMLDDSVLDPDLAVDLDAHLLQVEFAVATDNVWSAGEVSAAAMARAFKAARIDGPDQTRLSVHRELLNQAPSSLEMALIAV